MYDPAAARSFVDAWWRGLARAFRNCGVEGVPEMLTRPRRPSRAWRDPALLFSQTCGYPFMHRHRHHLRLLATPCYAATGCEGPRYSSLILVRESDPVAGFPALAGAHFAVNGLDSWSGWHALRREVAALGGSPEAFLARRTVCGAHRSSVAAVREGRARACAVDAVTWWLLCRHEPELTGGLRILERTRLAPGLPYVTSRRTPAAVRAAMRRGLRRAMADPALGPVREALGIRGLASLRESDYALMRGGS